MYSGLKLPLRWWQEGRREAGKQPQVNNQHQLSFLLKSRSGEGNGTHSSTLAMDGGAWWAAVHGVSKSQTRLSDFTFTFRFHALEKEMATHSSVLAWRIPGTGAWWAAVYGVAQSWKRLKRLSSSSSSSYSSRAGRSPGLPYPHLPSRSSMVLDTDYILRR